MDYERYSTKVSTFLSRAFNNPKFDIEFSKIIDSNTIKGKLVISIDPIDFILMSFNQSGWTSCHTISGSDDGKALYFNCHTSGIFSYIADDCTMISYRHNGTLSEFKLGSSHFKNYSKNWRQLIYYDTKNNAFFMSRQYPREEKTITKTVREFLEQTVSNNLNLENTWKIRPATNTSTTRKYLLDYVSGGGDKLHYNDLLNGRDGGKFIYNKKLNNANDVRILVGNKAVCPICGENEITDARNPFCKDCYEEFIKKPKEVTWTIV